MTVITAKSAQQRLWLQRIAAAQCIGWLFALAAASVAAADRVSTDADAQGPAQTAYSPAKGPGPVVIVISGNSGPPRYQDYAAEIAQLGYYSVLLDGNDILTSKQDGAANLSKAIERAQQSPHAVPGKAAVIGFSQGAGGALRHAAGMQDKVSAVVAYYPLTRNFTDIGALVKRFRVPVLILAGEADRFRDCCLIESMRAIETAAKESGAKFELVVYPQADHGFNLSGRNYRSGDTRDAWRRTGEALQRHHPLNKK